MDGVNYACSHHYMQSVCYVFIVILTTNLICLALTQYHVDEGYGKGRYSLL